MAADAVTGATWADLSNIVSVSTNGVTQTVTVRDSIPKEPNDQSLLPTPRETELPMNTIHEPQKLTAPARGTSVVPAGRDQHNGSPGSFKPEVIAIKNLRIEYRSREMGNQTKLAVKDLTLSVHAGEVFGFLGPNGAGKTTTMNVLLGFVPPTSGTADIFGVNVQQTIARQRHRLSAGIDLLLQVSHRGRTAAFLCAYLRHPRKPSASGALMRVLKLVELEHARKRPIKTYSKGMQQRVGLAQALINNPDLLILDEPTSGLDPLGRMKVRDIIKRLKNEGKTVFFSSHELGEVETICDRVAIMHQGELKAEGRVGDLAAQHQCNLEKLFLKIIGYQPRERLPMKNVLAISRDRHQGTVSAQRFLRPVRAHRADHC